MCRHQSQGSGLLVFIWKKERLASLHNVQTQKCGSSWSLLWSQYYYELFTWICLRHEWIFWLYWRPPYAGQLFEKLFKIYQHFIDLNCQLNFMKMRHFSFNHEPTFRNIHGYVEMERFENLVRIPTSAMIEKRVSGSAELLNNICDARWEKIVAAVSKDTDFDSDCIHTISTAWTKVEKLYNEPTTASTPGIVERPPQTGSYRGNWVRKCIKGQDTSIRTHPLLWCNLLHQSNPVFWDKERKISKIIDF